MAGEDAFKNYYTLAYYLQHNPAGLHFEGMNYPFGEHVIYTDNQPAVAMMLKAANAIVPLQTSLPLLMMLLVFISCALGAWAMSNTVKEGGLPLWLNGLLCIALVLLSPQLQRINGHYSLAYAGLIPVAFWLDHRVALKAGAGRWLALLSFLFILAFVHPYFLVMVTGVLILGHFAQHFLQRQKWTHYLKSLLLLIVPMLAFQILMALTDGIADRPANPYGFLVYKAAIESVFLPIGLPYFSFVTGTLSEYLQPSEEGFFYLGVSSILAAGLMIFIRIRKRTLLMQEADALNTQTFIYARTLGALPVLLLAMGIPFVIHPLEEFLPALGPLRQFRGIGRFVFVVYFALGLNLLWYVSLQFKQWRASGQAKALIIPGILTALLVFEAWSYRQQLLDTNLNQMAELQVPDLELNAASYQCIYPLPYFHIGSETFRTKANQSILRKSLELSMASGLPLNAVQMSRTSLSQTIAQFDLSTMVDGQPGVLDHYDMERPVLVVHVEGEPLSENDQRIVDHAQAVGEWNGLQLYAFSPEQLMIIASENRLAALPKIIPATQDSVLIDTVDSIGKEAPQDEFFFIGFGGANAPRDRANVHTLRRSAQNNLFKILPTGYLDAQESYVISFWIDASQPQSMNTQLLISESKDDESLQYNLFEVTDRIISIQEEWALIEIPFERQRVGSDLKLILYRDGEDIDVFLDDLMVRRPGSEVRLEHDWVNINNRFFEPSGGENVPLPGN